MAERMPSEHFAALMKQASAALFFGTSSILIVMVNKIVLTTYQLVVYVIAN